MAPMNRAKPVIGGTFHLAPMQLATEHLCTAQRVIGPPMFWFTHSRIEQRCPSQNCLSAAALLSQPAELQGFASSALFWSVIFSGPDWQPEAPTIFTLLLHHITLQGSEPFAANHRAQLVLHAIVGAFCLAIAAGLRTQVVGTPVAKSPSVVTTLLLALVILAE
jgi:hypothetical protein